MVHYTSIGEKDCPLDCSEKVGGKCMVATHWDSWEVDGKMECE